MASPTQSPSWERENPCPCRGCTVSRQQEAQTIFRMISVLHEKVVGPYDDYICNHCSILVGEEFVDAPYPCPTIRLFDEL